MSVGPTAAGDLDPTFSGDGKLIDGTLEHSRDDANGVAIQTDGKIVVAGSSEGGRGGIVARYNPDGSPDPAFGSEGWISGCYAADVAIQGDGKIVVGCTSETSPTSDFLIVRYHADGSLDAGFGIGGRIMTSMSAGHDYLKSIAIQPDGKIVAAGRSTITHTFDYQFTIARYNIDGSLDSTFHGDGKVITTVGSDAGGGDSLSIQSDGKILVAGGPYLTRLNANGSLDTSFDSDGTVTIGSLNFGCSGGPGGYLSSLTIQEDGRIVVAGASCGFILVRYNTDGSLDGTFGGDGTVLTQIPLGLSMAYVNSVAVRPDGKIVAVGTSRISIDQLDTDVAAARYNADGSLDTTFDGDGVVTTPVNTGWSQLNSVALLPDGRIIGVGYNSQTFGGNGGSNLDNFLIARYNENGSLDTGFDSDGMAITDFSYLSGGPFSDVAVQADGKILAASRYDLFRYNPDGTGDITFGANGRVNAGFSPIFSGQIIGLAIQADGKIVAAGTEYCGNDFDYDRRLARFNPDGSLDTSFAGDGVVFGCAEPSSGSLRSVAIQPDGKIVAAGESSVFRFNPDGSTDTTFGGGDGLVETGGTTFWVTAIAIGSDGRIALAGRACPGCPYSDFLMGRLNSDGSFDSTFGGDGIVITPFSHGFNRAASVVFQPDGRIVAAGTSSNGSNLDFAVVRYNSDGSFDTNFDSDGIVTTSIGTGDDTGSSVAIDNVGRLVVAGSSGGDFVIARYHPDGSLDTTLGGGDGFTTVDFNISNDIAHAMALDAQGRAVVVGEAGGAFGIARFLLRDAASAGSVIGRVTTASGRGIGNARVTLTGEAGTSRIATTSSFGYFRFDDVALGQTYTIAVRSKRYQFQPRTVAVTGSLTNVNFVPQ